MDKYFRPDELRAIADACETLQPLWELLTGGRLANIAFETENEAPHVMCYDTNGDTLGFISWSEDGPAFYAYAGDE